jgi:type IV pilus assembly protein PilX
MFNRAKSLKTKQTLITYRQEQGVILIVALIMLLVMTVTGVTTMTGSTLQERIAGNQRQQLVARINADQGLKAAETYLDSLHPGESILSTLLQQEFSSTDGLYTAIAPLSGAIAMPLGFERVNEGEWTAQNSIAVVRDGDTVSRYVIEYMGSFKESGIGSVDARDVALDERKVFRITAIGFGNNTNVFSVLESYYFEEGQ